MGKIRRGNYIFVTYVGDHGPRHVHVYRDRKLVTKWDLENACEMEGTTIKKVRDLIAALEAEGLL